MLWPEVRFNKIAEVVTGNTPSKSESENYGPGVPWVKPPDLDGFDPIIKTEEMLSEIGQKKARLLPTGAVMVSCIGSIGRVGIAGTTLSTNQQINSLIFRNLVEPRFGFYYCRTITGLLQASARNAVVPILNKSNFERLTMPVPPISEQRRIVEILDQANALSKKRAEADVKAELILPSLFYRMFGDPSMNLKKRKHAEIGKIVSSVSRRDPSGNPDSHFKYIDIAGVDGKIGRIVQVKTLLGINAPSRARQIIKTNDVLVSTVRPYLRATALVHSNLDNQICSTGFCVLRAKGGVGYGYLYALSRLDWFTQRLNERARGASYPAVTDNDILGLQVPYPSDQKMLIKCDEIVGKLNAMQGNRLLSSKKIDDLFNLLLHQAFSGDLTAKWREAHMKELLAEMEEQAKYLSVEASA